jgi:antitoxin ParD1/3/4
VARFIGNIWQDSDETRRRSMTTMNISLPEVLKQFVDQQVASAGYGTSSEYVRELIRRDQDRIQLRNLLLEGAQSAVSGVADAAYFDALRAEIKQSPVANS